MAKWRLPCRRPILLSFESYGYETGPREMMMKALRSIGIACGMVLAALTLASAQAPAGAGGRGGPPVQGAEEDIPLLQRFDRNRDKVLERSERDSARVYLAAHPELRRPARAGRITRVGTPGPRIAPADVKTYPSTVPLYDAGAIRTLFIDFEHPDWESELEAFYHTDVEVPATLRMDGVTYPEIGVGFRGNNSFTGVPAGLKRPLSITMDFRRDQKLLGYSSLNLLNANQDPTFLRSSLYLDIAREYIPAPKASFVRVVINGESWGLYVNQQTFSKEFAREAFGTTGGTRWKSPNNSRGGGFSYLGDSIPLYRRWYEMKGKDDTVAWRRLIAATKVMKETPPERLEEALAPYIDVDAALRFLALDVALANGDGYWNDGSDFNIYLSTAGRFTVFPHDANEGFRTSAAREGGPPAGSRPDPLIALEDTNKALRSRLLAAPALRARYLAYVGEIAEKWLDWQRLGPMVEKYRALIEDDVAKDTRKHETIEAFMAGIHGPDGSPAPPTSLKGFAEARRAYLLSHPEILKARGR